MGGGLKVCIEKNSCELRWASPLISLHMNNVKKFTFYFSFFGNFQRIFNIFLVIWERFGLQLGKFSATLSITSLFLQIDFSRIVAHSLELILVYSIFTKNNN